MNHVNSEDNKLNETVTDKRPETSKRSYIRKDKKSPTFASINELIEAKNLEIEVIQTEIEGLTAKRNELFFLESQEMGLMNILSDPDKTKWLTDIVKEAAHMKR